MNCSQESLQAFLDNELEEGMAEKLKKHLSGCRACRQELSRLKLLWLELAQPDEIDLPPELPYLRQQVISAARHSFAKQGKEKIGFWDSQKLALSPMKFALAYLPGAGLVKEAVKTTSVELPELMLNSLTRAGRLLKQRVSGKKGQSRK
ncbi:zf-HC2 domain-containing protein [Pelotomaculum propionicicum]|uniref:Anti-sigma-W factor RsiW n=1 Tax=Pelotomaculum propionicicum TaxID=258475 RepID=A0A4Y7RX58_9FIRM|nr:zf-HC2 domain-containing protein [Pelotomaculum propionicicum]NLI12709.1 zf-HC2 domain-containing protein [Peptococcaceae bacterium]TEB13501.1 hypothetical protein Pmgp_00395 [Pelotomaculum propionicicum]